MPPSAKVLDGREVTFRTAFAVVDAGDLVVEVTPDFQHAAGLDTS